MKLSYAIALLLTITIGVMYWYQSTSYICPVPVAYRLDIIDSSFSITEDEALAAIDQAVAIWEDATNVDLFVYDEQAELDVSFVFDERQATADAQASDEARLNAVANQNDEIRATIDSLQESYNSMQTAFESRKVAYDQALEQYNDQVRQANDRGGASPSEFAELQETQAELQAESRALREQADELNAIASQLNELSTEGNRLIRAYNNEVQQYNNLYSEGEEFTQGDYTGDAIHIYKFSNDNELVTVLAHEFGHALGIAGHVEEPGSIMYYLLEEGDEAAPILSEADQAAFAATCQFDSWGHNIRSIIRSIIS